MSKPESLQAFLQQSKFVLGDIRHPPARSPRIVATKAVDPSSFQSEVNDRARVATGIVGPGEWANASFPLLTRPPLENTPPSSHPRNSSTTELPPDAIAFTLRSSSYAAPTSSSSPLQQQVAMTADDAPATKASSNLRLRLQQLRSKVPSLGGGQCVDDLIAPAVEKETPAKPARVAQQHVEVSTTVHYSEAETETETVYEPMKEKCKGFEDLEETARLMEAEMLRAQQEFEKSMAQEQPNDQDVTEIEETVAEVNDNIPPHGNEAIDSTPCAKGPDDSNDANLLNEQIEQYRAYIQIAADLMRAIAEELGPDTAIKTQYYLRLTVDELKLELDQALDHQKKAAEEHDKGTWKVDADQIAAQMKDDLRQVQEKSREEEVARKKTTVDKSLEHQARFDKWPKVQARAQGSAQIRRVKLQNLSIHGNAGQVLSLVWGGRVEKLQYTDGETSAWVQFMKAEDCKRYYDATPNGIVVPGDVRVVEVEMDTIPMSTNEWVKSQIENGVTRCVRAVGVDEDIGMGALTNVATQKKRKVERIINGASQSGHRVVEFRFLSVEDAFNFKMELQKDEDWEHCNILFARDPCEMHTGVHMLP